MKRCAILALLCLPLVAGAETAEYDVCIEGLWDPSDASLPYPSGAHFTTFVGDTHVPGAALWQSGGFATPGVEDVAEVGSASTIFDEIESRVTTGTSGGEILISCVVHLPNPSPTRFLVEETQPEVSLISMVAPTPDWFVGVSGLSLRDETGWISQLAIDLHPYDAGTEEGSTFSLSNPATNPQQPIARRGPPFYDDVVLARLHFTRVPEPAAAPSWLAAVCVLLVLRRRDCWQPTHEATPRRA